VLLAGLVCATISSALGAFLYIHALITGGYSFYNPVELRCIRYGSLSALFGILLASIGKGRGRVAVLVVSTLNLLLWFMDAMAP
jgi:hypothetical protein